METFEELIERIKTTFLSDEETSLFYWMAKPSAEAALSAPSEPWFEKWREKAKVSNREWIHMQCLAYMRQRAICKAKYEWDGECIQQRLQMAGDLAALVTRMLVIDLADYQDKDIYGP